MSPVTHIPKHGRIDVTFTTAELAEVVEAIRKQDEPFDLETFHAAEHKLRNAQDAMRYAAKPKFDVRS